MTRLFRGCFSHGFKKNCYVTSSTDHHVGTRPSLIIRGLPDRASQCPAVSVPLSVVSQYPFIVTGYNLLQKWVSTLWNLKQWAALPRSQHLPSHPAVWYLLSIFSPSLSHPTSENLSWHSCKSAAEPHCGLKVSF